MSDPPPPPVPPAPRADPASIASSASSARTLTISDQHANVLLTSRSGVVGGGGAETADDAGAASDAARAGTTTTTTRSILKLTLVPFHKPYLSSVVVSGDAADAKKPSSSTTSERKKEGSEEKTKEEEEKKRERSGDGKGDSSAPPSSSAVSEKEHSDRVLSFLSKFDWRMTSESGAEYSFYEASPKTKAIVTEDDDDGSSPEKKRAKTDDDGAVAEGDFEKGFGRPSFKAELISPASDRQVSRYMPSPGLSMITETPSLYETIAKPFVEGIVSSGSLSWIENVVTVKKEKERLLHDGDGWILNVDTKWRTHPDAFTVPRAEWKRHESVADLYCLGIFKDGSARTLRDLDGSHLPLLRDVLRKGQEVIESTYGVPSDQLRIFVHYPPQFYHFHVHFTRLENDVGAQVERAHLLTDVIQNLELDPEYYKKRTMTFKLSLKDKLYKLLQAASSSDDGSDEKGGEEPKEEPTKAGGEGVDGKA